MRLILSCLVCVVLLSGCDTEHHWGEVAKLRDGQLVHIEREVVRGPDEFLIPDRGQIRRSTTIFPTTHGPVRTPDTLPGGNGRRLGEAPELVAYVEGDPVIAYRIVASDCAAFGHPPESIVAFRHLGGAWQRVPVSLLPPDTPLNLDSRALGPREYYPDPPQRLDEWIAESAKDRRGCVATAESARQAARYASLTDAYFDTKSTLAWSAAATPIALPPRAELDLVAALDAPIRGPDPKENGEEFTRRQKIREGLQRRDQQVRTQERRDAGCEHASLSSGGDSLEPAKLRYGDGPRDFIDVPQCDARCGSMQTGLRRIISAESLACTSDVFGTAMLVWDTPTSPARMVVARFARSDGALLRVDTLTLPPASGLPWGLPDYFRLGDDAQIDVIHRVRIGEQVYPDARHAIKLPPLDAG